RRRREQELEEDELVTKSPLTGPVLPSEWYN
ncbi:unnamed protein product, partial [marine sediment metagenome]